jgi:hypothetical protein
MASSRRRSSSVCKRCVKCVSFWLTLYIAGSIFQKALIFYKFDCFGRASTGEMISCIASRF